MKHVVLQICQTKMMTVYTLPDDIPAPEDSHTCNVKKCHLTEIVTDFTILKLILVNPATKAVSERSFSTARSLIENLALFKHESN